jgi:DNA-binding Xre family transcriptional regulator
MRQTHRQGRFFVCHLESKTSAVIAYISSVYDLRMSKSLKVEGGRLRRLRVKQALTLRDLGEMSGVAYDTINKLELCRRPARASTIRRLANALNVEPRELMKREE